MLWNSTKKFGATLIIILPQLNCIRSFLRFHIEYVGKALYCITNHLAKSIKSWKRCMSMCLINTSSPSFKYPWTQDLKSGISWISWGMNGCSCEIIHKKKYYPFPPAHIATTIWFDYISNLIGHFKFVNGLLY